MGKGSRIVKSISRFIWENKKDIAIIVVALIVLAGAGWVIVKISTSIMQMIGGLMQFFNNQSPEPSTTTTPTTTTTSTPTPTSTLTPTPTPTTTTTTTNTATTIPSGPWI